MTKQGYTWYPKDWQTSEAVFNLTLSERGFYRELIDIAMLNDNTIEVNYKVWTRKFAATEKELKDYLQTLIGFNLVELNESVIFIPSCEPRLNLIRGARKGGKKSKRKSTRKPKPNNYKEQDHLSITFKDFKKLSDEFGEAKANEYVDKVLNYSMNHKYKNLYLTALQWLRKDAKQKDAPKQKDSYTQNILKKVNQ